MQLGHTHTKRTDVISYCHIHKFRVISISQQLLIIECISIPGLYFCLLPLFDINLIKCNGISQLLLFSLERDGQRFTCPSDRNFLMRNRVSSTGEGWGRGKGDFGGGGALRVLVRNNSAERSGHGPLYKFISAWLEL